MANVLFNKESGLAEQLDSPEAAQSALEAGTHEVPLVNSAGEMHSASKADAADLLQNGYQQPSEQQLQGSLKHAFYSSPAQTARAAGLGVLESVPVVGTAAAKLKSSDEELNALREESPWAHAAGQGLGLIAGPGGAALNKVGQAVETGIGATSALGRIGSMAARGAAENAVFQTMDEANHAISRDPNTDMESAVAHIGLAGLLGAGVGSALGAVPELWKMGPGKRIEAFQQALDLHSQGVKPTVDAGLPHGIEIAPEIKAVFGDNPKASQLATDLMDSGSKRGTSFQETVANTRKQINEATPDILGRTAEDIQNIHNDSKATNGEAVRESLAKVISEKIAPIEEKLNGFTEKFGKQEMGIPEKQALTDTIAKAGEELGVMKSPGSAAAKLFSRVLGEMPLQSTIEDLQRYGSQLAKEAPFGSENYYAAKQIRSALSDSVENMVESRVGTGAPEALQAYQGARKEYGNFKQLIGELNDRLRMGRGAEGGKQGFLSSLNEMRPEQLVDRLNLKNDSGLQDLLTKHFPEVSEVAKANTLNDVIKKSLGKDGTLDATKLAKKVKEMAPELKNYLFSSEQQSRLTGLNDLMERLPSGLNTSRTASTLDKLWSKMPSGAVAAIAWATGHNPVVGALAGEMAHWLGREAPDAAKLAMLKYMGSGNPISASGFKAAAQTFDAILKGQKLLNNTVKSVYTGTMPAINMPSQADRDKLEKRINHLVENQQDAMSIGGQVGHYMPEHGSAIGELSARAAIYLQQLKPPEQELGLLQGKNVPNASQKADYARALDLAQSPLLIMPTIKNGTLTTRDIQHLTSLLPHLAQEIAGQLQQEMINAKAKGVEIPYRTKICLSMILNQPVESSLNPQNIQAAQPQTPPALTRPPSAAKMQGIQKLPNLYETTQQSRELHRTRQH